MALFRNRVQKTSPARYRAYGWETHEVDGHDIHALHSLLSELRQNQDKPIFITCRTTIGKGSPNKAGTHKVHGAPLGAEELMETKKALNLPDDAFYIPQIIQTHFEQKLKKDQAFEETWNGKFEAWQKAHPDLSELFHKMQNKTLPENLEEQLSQIDLMTV